MVHMCQHSALPPCSQGKDDAKTDAARFENLLFGIAAGMESLQEHAMQAFEIRWLLREWARQTDMLALKKAVDKVPSDIRGSDHAATPSKKRKSIGGQGARAIPDANYVVDGDEPELPVGRNSIVMSMYMWKGDHESLDSDVRCVLECIPGDDPEIRAKPLTPYRVLLPPERVGDEWTMEGPREWSVAEQVTTDDDKKFRWYKYLRFAPDDTGHEVLGKGDLSHQPLDKYRQDIRAKANALHGEDGEDEEDDDMAQ